MATSRRWVKLYTGRGNSLFLMNELIYYCRSRMLLVGAFDYTYSDYTHALSSGRVTSPSLAYSSAPSPTADVCGDACMWIALSRLRAKAIACFQRVRCTRCSVPPFHPAHGACPAAVFVSYGTRTLLLPILGATAYRKTAASYAMVRCDSSDCYYFMVQETPTVRCIEDRGRSH